jgi:deoxyribonuclease-4
MADGPPAGVRLASWQTTTDLEQLGARCAELFLGNPFRWEPAARADSAELRAAGLPLFVHGSLLINPASASADVRDRSRTALVEYATAAAAIGARGLLVHGGYAEDGRIDLAPERWASVLSGLSLAVALVVENDVAPTSPTSTLAGIEALWPVLAPAGGALCVDLCHLHGTGAGPEPFVRALQRAGVRIGLVEISDAVDPFASGRHRHVGLGDGSMDVAAALGAATLAQAPVICETPAVSQRADIATVDAALRRGQR